MQRANYGDIVEVLGNFVSNHDQARLDLVVPDVMLQRALLLTMLTSVGMPVIYYGLEQGLETQQHDKYSFDAYRSPLWQFGYPTDTTWYKWFATVGRLRHIMPKSDFAHAEKTDLFSAPDLYVYARGQVIVVVTNRGSVADIRRQEFKTTWKDFTVFCNVFDPSDCIRVGQEGSLTITLYDGESKLYAPAIFVAPSESSLYASASFVKKYIPNNDTTANKASTSMDYHRDAEDMTTLIM